MLIPETNIARVENNIGPFRDNSYIAWLICTPGCRKQPYQRSDSYLRQYKSNPVIEHDQIMISGETSLRRQNDLDFLKSIVEADHSSISRIDEEDEQVSHHSNHSLPARPKSSRGERSTKSTCRESIGRAETRENGDGDYAQRLTRTEMWARGELDDSWIEQTQRKPRRVASGRHGHRPAGRTQTRPAAACKAASYQMPVDPVAYRLEQKYNELKQLLQGNHANDGPQPHGDLIRLATKRAHRYHMEAQGLVCGEVASSRSLNGKEQKDGCILIDGTGSMVRTSKVHFVPKADGNTNMADTAPRGRSLVKRTPPKKKAENAWGSKNNSQVSLDRSSPSKTSKHSSGGLSRSLSPEKRQAGGRYSDSYTTDSSSSSGSRSRSRSRGKTCDLHLKYTKNKKLLEWLKNKDQLERANKKQHRREVREKRRAEKLKLEEQEALKEKSQKKVAEWMRVKSKEARLLRRDQKPSFLDQKSTIEEFVVIDEMLDLREHGARIDPSQVPEILRATRETLGSKKKADEELKPKRPASARPIRAEGQRHRVRGRPQSATNVPFVRSTSAKKGRFGDGARQKARRHKEKVLQEQETEQRRRTAYHDWLKSKRSTVSGKASKDSSTQLKPTCSDEHEVDTAVKKAEGEGKGEVALTVTDRPEAAKQALRGTDTKARPKSCTPRVKPTKQQPISVPTSPAEALVAEQKESLDSPRPELHKGLAYVAVKHEQKSWEDFADHVWKQTNEAEGAGSEGENTGQPEPQGPDAQSITKAMSANSDDVTTAINDITTPQEEAPEKSEENVDNAALQPDVGEEAGEGRDNQVDGFTLREPPEGDSAKLSVPGVSGPAVSDQPGPVASSSCPEPEAKRNVAQ